MAGPAALLVVWILIWGELSAANVASGLLVVGAVVALDARFRRPRAHHVHALGVILLVADLFGRLVLSSLQVAWTVLRPTAGRLRAGVVAAPLHTDSALVATIVADLISLTPGTVTLDVRDGPTHLLVHVLGLEDPEAVVAEIAALEQRVLRAVHPIDLHPGGLR